MNRSAYVFCFVVATLAALGGCGGGQPGKEAKKAAAAPHKIQGRAQLLQESIGLTDAALNQGGPSVYIWEGPRRYRLFLRTPTEVVHGREYVVEGVHAQRVIDEIGDPDQGKSGYPLKSSCERVVTMAWGSMAFDELDAQATVLRVRVNRYPARPVFLVTKLEPAPAAEEGQAAKAAKAGAKDIREVSVPAEKQSALLIKGQTVHAAPLWAPQGGTAKCKVLIDEEGKISELQTGVQLCEAVPWSEFLYKPTVQGGRPVLVATEVEVRFEPRK